MPHIAGYACAPSSLYHQRDTFVTPENISQKINEAFVPQRNSVNLTSNFDKRSFAELMSHAISLERASSRLPLA
ncbi:uncharacterized protein BJ212DRAFT_1340057 [Suillus subaureus]|uniref:Uncharacterized protein n=1 Tax=Suillus subaureus TaxID=48587 RepID=A0A9P7EGY7_9AGAM|nr:uncharacterized protein BJ212DRAFT_1340057 [Suillus subaureus]KAG1820424.1 hypothetical protein BJ212DRAFT_1340057 [Suillus subaureus]